MNRRLIYFILLQLIFTTSICGQDFPKEYIEKIERLAKQGNAKAQYDLGNLYSSGNINKKNKKKGGGEKKL